MKFVRFRSGLSENFLILLNYFGGPYLLFLDFLKSVSFPDFWSGVFCSFFLLFLCCLYNIRLIRICQYNFSIFFTLSLSYQPSFKVMADNSANIDHLWKMSFYIFSLPHISSSDFSFASAITLSGNHQYTAGSFTSSVEYPAVRNVFSIQAALSRFK